MNEMLGRMLMAKALIMVADCHKPEDLSIGPEKRRIFEAAVIAARQVEDEYKKGLEAEVKIPVPLRGLRNVRDRI